MKKVLLPLVGAGIFLLDESLKNYAEENLQLGTEKKLTGRIVLRRVHNQGVGFELLSECPEEVKKLSLAVRSRSCCRCRKRKNTGKAWADSDRCRCVE